MSAPARVTDTAVASPIHRSGRWIENWNPEDATFWRDGGRVIARRNLAFSIFAEFLGFCVWALWSVVVPLMPAAGFRINLDQQFWLIVDPEPGRRDPAPPVHLRGAPLRRPQLDDHLLRCCSSSRPSPWRSS